MKDVIALRIGIELLREIDKLSKKMAVDRSTIVRELLIKGLKEFLKENAAQQYIERRITLSEAARLANLTIWEMECYLVERGFKSEYSIEDLEREMKVLKI